MINSFYLKIIYKIIELIDFTNKKKIVNFFKNYFLVNKIVIIDIGAHKGETVDIFCESLNIEKIFSFEPNNLLFSKLSNDKKYKNMNIEFLNFGVGEKKETKHIKIYEETSSSGFNDLDLKSKYYKKKMRVLNFFSTKNNLSFQNQPVDVISLSDFFKEKNLNKIDILKIDTEGYEYNVLKGLNEMDFTKINLIYFEHHYDSMIKKNYTFSAISDLLKKNGFYKTFKIKMKFRKSFEYIYKNSKNTY